MMIIDYLFGKVLILKSFKSFSINKIEDRSSGSSINVWADRPAGLTLPLTVQVPGQTGQSSSPLYNSSQYFLPASYSISLLHSNLNVITSSSVIADI